MSRLAAVFPGQGAQSVGMGRDVFEASPAGRAVFERANRVLGFDLARCCFEGPADKLEQTDVQQPAIFVTSIAIWEAFLEAGERADWFGRCGGLSLGEYTALHSAGAMGLEEGLRLVRRRGELMQQAALQSASGMVSLIGADEAAAGKLCEAAAEGDVLVPANYNCPGQIVIAGSKAACARAVEKAESFGCRAVSLAVAGAFHSPFMESAARGLHGVLHETLFAAPRIPVVANVSAGYHLGDAPAIRATLERQLTSPVLWQRCVERLAADGTTTFVEFGPGRVLTGLLRKIDRNLKAINVSTMDGVRSAVSELAALVH